MLTRTKLLVQISVVGIIENCLVLGCGKGGPPDNPYMGNMNDFSYSVQWSDVGCIFRVNALGEEVCVDRPCDTVVQALPCSSTDNSSFGK